MANMVLTLLGDHEMSVKKIQRGVKHRVEFFTRISWLPSEVCPFLHFWKCEVNWREGSTYSHQWSNLAQNEENILKIMEAGTIFTQQWEIPPKSSTLATFSPEGLKHLLDVSRWPDRVISTFLGHKPSPQHAELHGWYHGAICCTLSENTRHNG